MSAQINYRRHGLVDAPSVSLAVAGAGRYDASDSFSRLPLDSEGRMPSLDGATAWLNSPPLRSEEARGAVVLVDFWTYTCINWLRTLPYIRAWHEKYRAHGLLVLGAHTPEFPFEHDLDNVRRAVEAMRITYPIVVDNDYVLWEAFNNHYWPALYLVDAQGRICHQQFGEGDYEEAERVIQHLLRAAGKEGFSPDLVTPVATGVEVAADWAHLGSGESYLGAERAEGLASPGGAYVGERHAYTLPAQLSRNEWALAGEWRVEPGVVALSAARGRIASRFHARDVHLVMGPAVKGASVRYRVLLDGQAVGAAGGGDVDERGEGVVSEQRLHQLLRQPGSITDRTFEIEFLDAGVEAYAFTFG